PRFAAAIGPNLIVDAKRQRLVLEAALRTRPGDLTLLMELGASYPINQREGAGERARWFQAAVAAHPYCAAAHSGLGVALRDKGDLDGAVAAYRQAIRLDPGFAVPHNNLGNALYDRKDLDAAVAAYREAVRLDSKFAPPHN